ncbi:low molecular weight protein tyrosine phosphatase family protein [Pseudomonas sp. NPDC079086]|jgi:predicted protein tyrosine phosphatase|uniref:low molecular weight protein tyrosine phosphatase family protein n=1 Tax=unclassified Pseudomonas TaxID=196821 RepID=UPI001DDD2093|nr:phosphotyrosine protein phosphatase [Gammaproteobacteria bacterium]MBU2156169.1 phosphotyrosine protein phosphatase [Gammaproteobacteria bacterium]MBU2256712.1 phosphotyrosine protein phosphatase [Gammaproteobacteria bacterium]MBU2293079.1 phosphotyrosine protein phosphatase [Gammaproteobacteria bacterium]
MPLRVLFICAKNRLRSPTAEQVFADWPGVETASAGVNRDADIPVSPELLEWAELILVMESRHRRKLAEKFRRNLANKPIHSLNIPDDYAFMEPALVQVLQQRVPQYFSR